MFDHALLEDPVFLQELREKKIVKFGYYERITANR